jgi:NADH-quinone oxidoreductase subunit L
VFLLAAAGVASAYYFYMVNPKVPAAIKARCGPIYRLLDNKYYLDAFNEIVFAKGARLIGSGFSLLGDRMLIDGLFVNGSAKLVGWFSTVVRKLQSGYIYHYAFVMILGVLGFLVVFLPFPRFPFGQ